jgi:hypothetical protein
VHSFWSRERDGPPSLLPRRVGWVGVVGLQDQPSFVVSGTLHGLGGKNAKARSTPCIIPGVSFEQSLRLSFTV